MVHGSAVEFTWGDGKNMSFPLIPNLRKFEKYLKQLEQAPLKNETHKFCTNIKIVKKK